MQCRYIVSARLQSVKVGAASGVVFSGVHFQLCEALQSCCHNGDTDATHTGMQGPLQCSSSISTAAAGEKTDCTMCRTLTMPLCRQYAAFSAYYISAQLSSLLSGPHAQDISLQKSWSA